MARAETQPVRLPADLVDELRKRGKAANRSVPLEAETRLSESIKRGAWAEVEPQLAARPRALGRLLGLLAAELAAHSPTNEEFAYFQHGTARMLERLNGKGLSETNHPAATIADYWWLRLNNAQERTYENGVPIPMTPEQRALAEIRLDLGIGEAAVTEQPQEKREAP
ncbi:MAG TPA: hypothetical protein VHC00_00485 [Rhizobiaceae bacterium]|nr:hypothetical protein [Rhizobiaceae bacterium]